MVDVGDAVAIRRAGTGLPLLLYGGNLPTPETVAAVTRFDLMPTLHDEASAAGFLGATDAPLRVFLEVNVGGERLGFEPNAVPAMVARLRAIPRITIAGIYAHMHVPGDTAAEATIDWQFARLQAVLRELDAAGTAIPVRMTASSKTLILTTRMNLSAIDPGHLVFGLHPGGARNVDLGLRPALMRLTSRLVQVRRLTRPDFRDQAPFPVRDGLRVGVIPLGASDGLTRVHAGAALVRGTRVPLLGNPSAEHARLDLSGLPEAAAGDEVTIIGCQGDEAITLTEVRGHQGGVREVDVTRAIGRTIPRIYVEETP